MIPARVYNLRSWNQPCYQTINHPTKYYFCSLCRHFVSGFTHILTQKTIYCVPCFAKLKKWPHQYQVINSLDFLLLDNQWRAGDQLLLLQGLQDCLFQNWEDIQDQYLPDKTLQQIQDHYTRCYLDQPLYLPSLQYNKSDQKMSEDEDDEDFESLDSMSNGISYCGLKVKTIAGVFSKRNDYEEEYDYYMEYLLANECFEQERQDEQDISNFEYTIPIAQIYNKKLTIRERVKDFVRSRRIFDLRLQTALENVNSQRYKQIDEMMKIFSRYQTASDHKDLVKGITRQIENREKIKKYKQMRLKGIKTLLQLHEELEKQEKQKVKTAKSKQSAIDLPKKMDRKMKKRNKQQIEGYFSNQSGSNSLFEQGEINLMRRLKLSSLSYIIIKETLIRQSLKSQRVKAEKLYEKFALEKHIIKQITEYLISKKQILAKI